ncbi:helix-turn-helix domain-containing protein [Niabella sp. CJ426]|uniref:helix-turn-helix domain-containing protein n=1 Tax=Niabella sp. CJ426 TaxID=3393740 RepID=UPI003CFDFC77
MSNFGSNIKKIRSLKNYTQQHLADILGLTRAAVSSYEEGRAEPKIETLTRASQIFGVSVDDFINKKLTVNEVTHFKVPEIAPKTTPTNPGEALFPSNANWVSIKNATIIDNRFTIDQIILAKEDEISIFQPQIIYTGNATFVVSVKKIANDKLLISNHAIALSDITFVKTILGWYQPLSQEGSGGIFEELDSIKNRLSELEKKIAD